MIYPMYHPAAALHNQNLRKVIEEDFKAIPSLVKQGAKETQPEEPPAQQLSMFSQNP